MKIYLNVKQAGSRKNFITKEEFILENVPFILKELISEIIRKNVYEYNNNLKKEKLIDYLTESEIDSKAELGKVSFGNIYNENKQNLNKALETAFTAYEDGIYKVFINDDEIERLDQKIDLEDGDTLTFIKFVMLAGGLW